MGRGRAKAKQTKVARALKYGGPQTDLERLQAELAGGGSSDAPTAAESVDDSASDSHEEDPYEDPYARYIQDEDDDNED